MAFLVIQQQIVPNWQWGGSTGYVRTFASQSFYEATIGTFVPQGRPSNINSFCQEATCSISGTDFTIPQITLATTADSNQPQTTYTTVLYDENNVSRFTMLSQYVVDPEYFQVPVEGSMVVEDAGTAAANAYYTFRGTSAGYDYFNVVGQSSSITLYALVNTGSEWRIYNAAGTNLYHTSDNPNSPADGTWVTGSGSSGSLPVPNVSESATTVTSTWENLTIANEAFATVGVGYIGNGPFWNAAQVREYVNNLVGDGTTPYATSLVYGKTALSVDPVVSGQPIAVGENDPHFAPAFQEFVIDYVSLAAAVTAIGSTECELVVTAALTPVAANVTIPATTRLTFEGNGSVTVSGGNTLTISSMSPTASKQVFFGAGDVRFAKGAIAPFNLAWWAGTTPPATNVDHAFAQALLSLAANAGGILQIPAGVWLISTAITLSNSYILEGVGSLGDAGQTSVIKIRSGTNNISILKVIEGFRNNIIRDLVLDCGTSTGSKCFSATDAILSSGFGLHFQNVTFHNGQYGTYFTTADGWEIESVYFEHCQWVGQTIACNYNDSVNGSYVFLQPYLQCGAGVHAFDWEHTGTTTVINHTILGVGAAPMCVLGEPNPAQGGTCFRLSGTHPPIHIINGQDEGMAYFLYVGAADYTNPIVIQGCAIQSLSVLDGSCWIKLDGNSLISRSFRAAALTQCYIFGDNFIRPLDYCGNVVAPVLVDPASANAILHMGNLGNAGGTAISTISNLPTAYFCPPELTGAPTTPMVSFLNNPSVPEEKVQLRFGLATSAGVADNYYNLYRSYTDGRAKLAGNQTGFQGLDVVSGDVGAVNFNVGFTTVATAAGTTTLTKLSNGRYEFTGATTQIIVMPVASTCTLGQAWNFINRSSGALTVNSSGGNLIQTIGPNASATASCRLTSGTSAASWNTAYSINTTASKAELDFVVGVTSAIQTQINTKSPIASPTFTGTVTTPNLTVNTGSALAIATGTSLAVTGLLTSSSPTAGVGYATGSGGAVTQITSRTTGVTLNTVTGGITLFSAAGSATPASFTVTNSAVIRTDTIIINQQSGTDLYEIFITDVSDGSFQVTFFTTGGTTAEQPVFNFCILKGVVT